MTDRGRIKVKRVYDDVAADDGHRVLVDRLWPRGLSKEAASLDDRLPEIAPSDELRRWYDHDPDRFDEFSHRYLDELDDDPHGDVERVLTAAEESPVTLLTATRDLDLSHAVVLADHLRELFQEENLNDL